MSGITGYSEGAQTYPLSNGTSTTDFWTFHEDSMKGIRKSLPPSAALQPLESSVQSHQSPPKFQFLDLDTLIKNATAPESDPKLLASIEKLRKFAEARKKSNYMAMNFYSNLDALYKPLTDKDLGGEWSDPTKLRASAKNYIREHLSAEGYTLTTENVIVFVERYMTEFPNLHLKR